MYILQIVGNNVFWGKDDGCRGKWRDDISEAYWFKWHSTAAKSAQKLSLKHPDLPIQIMSKDGTVPKEGLHIYLHKSEVERADRVQKILDAKERRTDKID